MKSWVTAVIWIIVVAGGIYFPFIRSPEMTNAQLFRSYWWFYGPSLIAILALTWYNHAPKRRMRK
jgi:hypothetical protein